MLSIYICLTETFILTQASLHFNATLHFNGASLQHFYLCEPIIPESKFCIYIGLSLEIVLSWGNISVMLVNLGLITASVLCKLFLSVFLIRISADAFK